MVDQAEREPTMEEIVVALRETRKGAGRAPPLTVVDGQRDDRQQSNPAASIAAADLRDQEIERLLTDNARLNERVMFLLRLIEREQARNAPAAPAHQGATLHEVRAILQAELRPVLQVLLQVLEKPHAHPTGDDGIIDLDALHPR